MIVISYLSLAVSNLKSHDNITKLILIPKSFTLKIMTLHYLTRKY